MVERRRVVRQAVLALIVGMAVVIRAWVSHGVLVVANDAAAGYLYQARQLLGGQWSEGLGRYFSPGYPLTVALISPLLGDVETAGRLVSILGGALLVLPVFFMALRYYGEPTAWAAAGLVASYPVLVVHSSDAVTEGLFTLLLFLGIAEGCRFLERPSLGRGISLGALFAFAYLTRGEALCYAALLLGAGTIWHLTPRATPEAANRRLWVMSSLGFVVGFALLSLPYVLFLHQENGGWQLSGKTMENLLSYDITEDGRPVDIEKTRMSLAPDGKSLRMETVKQDSALAFLMAHRGRELRRYSGNLIGTYLNTLPRVLYPLDLVFMGIGWTSGLLLGGAAATRRDLFLAAIVVFPFLFYPLFLVEIRYFVPILPVALIWTGRGLVSVAEIMARGRERMRHWVLAVLVLATIGLHSWPLVQSAAPDGEPYPLEHKAAGEWLREHGEPGCRVMNRKAYVAFYAGGHPEMLPYASLEEILSFARFRKTDYLVLDERYTIPVRPWLKPLLDDAQAPDSLRLVYRGPEVPNRRIVIYEVRPE